MIWSWKAMATRLAVWTIGIVAFGLVQTTAAQVTAPAGYSFGAVSLGSSASTSVTFSFTASTAVASVSVVTQGATGQDFQVTSPDTSTSLCTAKTYTNGQSCTVDITFAPLAPGQRQGAAVLRNSSNQIIGTAYVNGVGSGAQLGFAGPTVSTPVGTGTYSLTSPAGLSGNAAAFLEPGQIAFDGAGNMYVDDLLAESIYKVTPAGLVSVVIGKFRTNCGSTYTCGYPTSNSTTLGTASNIYLPSNIMVDGAGQLWFADESVGGVATVDLATDYVTAQVPGNGNVVGAPATSGNIHSLGISSLGFVFGFASDGLGNVYVAAYNQGTNAPKYDYSQILKIDSAGNVSLVAGAAVDYTQNSAPADGSSVTSASFGELWGLAIDPSGNLYSYDRSRKIIYKVDTSGKVHPVAGSGSIASDNASGLPYWQSGTASTTSSLSVNFAANGGLLAVDPNGNVYFPTAPSTPYDTTSLAPRVYVFTPSGYAYVLAGNGTIGEVNGPAASSELSAPDSVALNGTGDVYVSENYIRQSQASPAVYVGSSIRKWSMAASTLNFGSVAKGGTSTGQTVTATNLGNASMVLTAPSSGTNPSPSSGFALLSSSASNACVTGSSGAVAIGSSCTVIPAFQPHISSGSVTGTLTFAGNLATGTSVPLSGTAAAGVASLKMMGLPANTNAAVSNTVTVTALDASSNTFTGYTGTVQFSLAPTDVAAALPSAYTFTGSEGGTKTFSVALSASGSHTLTVSDTANGLSAQEATTVAQSGDSTSVTVGSSSSPVDLGGTVTLTAVVKDTSTTSTVPTGGVTFSDLVGTTTTALNGGAAVSLIGGTAQLTGVVLSGTGTHTITANYAGVSGSFASSSNTTTVTVNSALVATQAVAGTTLAAGVAATSFTPVTASGGTTAYSYAVSPSLPTGLTISSTTGAITGTPTAGSAATTYTVTVTDATSATAGATFSLTVATAPLYLVTVSTDTTTGVAANCPNQNATPVVSGPNCSLRDALSAAAANATSITPATITFSPATFTSATTITEVHGTLTIPNYTTIQGLTAGSTAATKTNLITVSGAASSVMFTLNNGVTGTLANLNITGGSHGIQENGISSSITVNQCNIYGNSGAISGGGIFITGNATITNSAIYNNSVLGYGAGVLVAGGTLTMSNTTVSGNSGGPGGGGGLYINGGSASITGTTFANNTATGPGGGLLVGSSVTVGLTDSIVATNSSSISGYADIDLQGSVSSSGGNVAGYNSSGTSQVANIALAPLGFYGGPTKTQPSMPQSPATLCVIANPSTAFSALPVTDQRGYPRSTTYGSTPCVDTGATQTAYSVQFAQQPTNVAINTSISPSPTVQIYDNGSSIALSGASVGVTAAAGTLSGTTPQTTSAAGLSTFGNLAIAQLETNDTLTAQLAVTSTINVTATSSNFNVINPAVTATQAIASTALTQNHAATSFVPVTGSNGTGTLSYSLSPALPAGLSYSSTTGAVSGTPTATSTSTSYTVTVTDSTAATASATFSLAVNAAVTATQAVASTTLTQNRVATSFTPVTGANGTGSLAYSVSPTLPTGLSLSSSTGAITGTATGTSTATTYTVTVTDANGATATATFSLTVNTAVTATQAVASTTLTANRAATSFTPVTGAGGTTPLAYSVSPTLPSGLSLSSTTGAVTGTASAASAAATYTVTVTDANSATATATFSLTVSAAVAATTNVATTALTQNRAATSFTPVAGSGGTSPLSYSVSPSLPAGLAYAASTGAITGTATGTSSATSYTVTVTDANSATATAGFSLTVNVAVSATTAVASTTLSQGHAATAFTPVTGGGGTGALTYSVSPSLPTGLLFSTSTGAVSGTPGVTSSATTYTVTITDTNGSSANASFSLAVAALSATQSVASAVLTQNHATTAFIPVTGSGGTGTLSYSISPALPAGLNFAASNGAVSGTPTATSAAATYTVTVTDSNSVTASSTFSLTVNAAVTATQSVATTALTQNHATTAFTPVTGGGGTAPLTYAVSPVLPAGLSFSTTTGAVTGTPTGTSTATTYTVTVTDANSATASSTFSLTVNASVTATQVVASTVLTQKFAATPFTPVTGAGGTGTLTYSVSPTLPTGLSISSSTGAISGTASGTSSATTYTVTVTDADSATASATFSLTISSAVTATQAVASTALTQSYAATAFTPVTGAGGTGTLSFSVSPALPTGLSLSTTTGAITGTPTVSGAATTYIVTVTDHNGATASATFSVTVASAVTATTAVASTTLSQNRLATAFTPVTGAGGYGTLTYSVSPALPAGLSLSSTTGAVTGTPTAVSSATTYTVTVTDANSATATATFSLAVTSITATQAIASEVLTQNRVVTAFVPVTGAGGTGTLTYSVSPALPTGLLLSSSSGAVSGTPTAASTATTYTITVTDANGATASATFSLTVNVAVSATVSVATTALTQGRAATVFTPVSGAGGTGTLTYSVSPSLPAGLSFSTNTGLVTGTATGTGSATTYTVTVTDANGATATASFSLTVNAAVTATIAVANTTLTENVAATSFTPITATGGTGTLTFSVSPSLPAGLNFSTTTGAITGTPTVTIPATSYTVTATDTNGATANAAFSLTIVAVPTTVSVSAVSSPYGSTASITVTANEAGSAGVVTGGIVTFGTTGNVGGSFSPATCTLSAAGTCTTTYTPSGTLTAGTYAGSITASFAATGNYTAASGAAALTITQVTPAVSLVSSVNPVLVQNTVTLTATVSSSAGAPANGDTVTFYDNTAGAALGKGTLSAGIATLSISTLTVGTHSITAIFAGDTNFITFTSQAVSEQVDDFSLAISTTGTSSTSQTVVPGGTATYSFTISPTGVTTFPAAVTLSVTGLPAGATYTITPLTIAAGAGATPVTLTINVPKQTAMLHTGEKFAPLALALLLLPFGGRMRRRAGKLSRLVALLLLMAGGTAGLAALTGCGSSTGFFASPQTTYSVTVTGTSGALTHSTTVTLTVQ